FWRRQFSEYYVLKAGKDDKDHPITRTRSAFQSAGRAGCFSVARQNIPVLVHADLDIPGAGDSAVDAAASAGYCVAQNQAQSSAHLGVRTGCWGCRQRRPVVVPKGADSIAMFLQNFDLDGKRASRDL